MVSQTVAVLLPREADSQRTFPKPSAAVGMQEEHGGLPRRSEYAAVLHVLASPSHQLFHLFNTSIFLLINQRTFQAYGLITVSPTSRPSVTPSSIAALHQPAHPSIHPSLHPPSSSLPCALKVLEDRPCRPETDTQHLFFIHHRCMSGWGLSGMLPHPRYGANCVLDGAEQF